MNGPTVEYAIDLRRGKAGRLELRERGADEPPPPPRRGRVPRVARLMALAIRFEGLIRAGTVRDQADLARLGHVTRARITQIMSLLHLAPDIQEELLHLPEVAEGRDPITERHLRPVAALIDWRKQRRLWSAVRDGAPVKPQAVTPDLPIL